MASSDRRGGQAGRRMIFIDLSENFCIYVLFDFIKQHQIHYALYVQSHIIWLKLPVEIFYELLRHQDFVGCFEEMLTCVEVYWCKTPFPI